ncbi:LuxR C-terminal-related transcriptional regulator [Streptomyces virginiae]|uniref:LuxR C-terminal-related transcriptional regulator n=1 Tax=Streptomyces TaxID=1883 RepID=UPI002E285284|nr:LuxR C-terminal-related transcriptional regulator [Streptomyces sp. NBC_00239]WSX96977.1 LuxR C-terminal-related transcriptional regulator [Streptomyces goshikiensis]
MTSQAPSAVAPLTPVQRPIAQHVVEGWSNTKIAKECWVSPSTVTTHLRRIRVRLHGEKRCSRAVLAHTLLRYRLVDPPPLPPKLEPFTPSRGTLLLLRALAEHSLAADIAEAAQIAPTSVGTRTRKLMRTMQATDPAHLIGIAHALGFLRPGPPAQPAAAVPSDPGTTIRTNLPNTLAPRRRTS